MSVNQPKAEFFQTGPGNSFEILIEGVERVVSPGRQFAQTIEVLAVMRMLDVTRLLHPFHVGCGETYGKGSACGNDQAGAA